MGGGKIFLLVITAWIAYSCVSGSDNGESAASTQPAERRFTDMDALTLCQMALKGVSKDPENASVPYVPNMGSGSEYYFAWGASTKMARMRNGLGLEVAASASCIVDGNTKRITSLTLNGETIR